MHLPCWCGSRDISVMIYFGHNYGEINLYVQKDAGLVIDLDKIRGELRFMSKKIDFWRNFGYKSLFLNLYVQKIRKKTPFWTSNSIF